MLIVGMGNYLFGDEGVGLHVVEKLGAMQRPTGVDLLALGNGGFQHLGALQDSRRILWIDAVYDEQNVGTITAETPQSFHDYSDNMIAYQTGLKDLLQTLYIQKIQPSTTLYLIAVAELQPMSVKLSPAVEESAQRVTEMIRQHWDSLRL